MIPRHFIRAFAIGVVLGFAACTASLALHGCGAPQQPAPSSPAPSVDARTMVRSIAVVALPQIRVVVDAQITDPATRVAVDAAFAPASDAIQAATARSVCEALPLIDRALADLDARLAVIPGQTATALAVEHASIAAARVGLPLSFPQCAGSGVP